jgi:hypothetical protein
MEMTHDELLEKINPFNTTDENTYLTPYNALRAVVELHKPSDWDNCIICSGATNETLIKYPCSTIKVIEKELVNATNSNWDSFSFVNSGRVN